MIRKTGNDFGARMMSGRVVIGALHPSSSAKPKFGNLGMRRSGQHDQELAEVCQHGHRSVMGC